MVTGLVVGMKIAEAIASAFASSMKYGPIVGGALGLGAMALILSSVKAPKIPIEDGEIENFGKVKVNALPMDSVQIDKQNNKISVGTNLNGGNMDAVVKKLDEVIKAVNRSSDLQVTTTYDSFQASSNKASGGIKQTNTKYKSEFA